MIDKSRLVRINGRMIAVDLYGNGKDDLVVAKNTPQNLLGTTRAGNWKPSPGPAPGLNLGGVSRTLPDRSLISRSPGRRRPARRSTDW